MPALPNKPLTLPTSAMTSFAILPLIGVAKPSINIEDSNADEPIGCKNKVGDLGVRHNEIENIGLNWTYEINFEIKDFLPLKFQHEHLMYTEVIN